MIKIIVLPVLAIVCFVALAWRTRRTTTTVAPFRHGNEALWLCPDCRVLYRQPVAYCPRGHRTQWLALCQVSRMACGDELLWWPTDRYDPYATEEMTAAIWGDDIGAAQIIEYRRHE